jgi:hypothetical protein
MTAASRSLATALWKARFASGLLMKCYTTSWDTICLVARICRRRVVPRSQQSPFSNFDSGLR